ncbi:MAG TPA: DUF4468 domain-containing protein [Bacteroidia bacterium]|nr:DUF4468 domain-containing protein [Bacteroidia bacterium]
MRNFFIFGLVATLNIFCFAQKDFKWDTIDSVSLNKNDIYSLTKAFIAEKWVSAKDVIQNDDKDGGIIILKGTIKEILLNPIAILGSGEWIFSYTVKFMFKDHKSRIIIENVNCIAGPNENWPLLPVADDYPEEKGRKKTGLGKEKYLELMSNLKKDLQDIVDTYRSHLYSPKSNEW